MTMFRKLVLSTAAAATLVASATPALARPWGGGYGGYGGWHGYHHGGDVGGALVGGLIVGGLIGAIAASSDRGPPAPRYRVGGPDARAADICAAAVEGDRGGRVRQITNIQPFSDGWRVEGVVDTADRDGRGYAQADSFGCTIRYGRVEDVRYGSEYGAR